MAYLDNSGLSYFWGKLKVLLNNKLGMDSENVFPDNTYSYITISPNYGLLMKSKFSNTDNALMTINGLSFSTSSNSAAIILSNKNSLRCQLGLWNNAGLINIEIKDAKEDTHATTLGQVKSLIAESSGGGISEEVQTALDDKVSKSKTELQTMDGGLLFGTTEAGNDYLKIENNKLKIGKATTVNVPYEGEQTWDYPVYFENDTSLNGTNLNVKFGNYGSFAEMTAAALSAIENIKIGSLPTTDPLYERPLIIKDRGIYKEIVKKVSGDYVSYYRGIYFNEKSFKLQVFENDTGFPTNGNNINLGRLEIANGTADNDAVNLSQLNSVKPTLKTVTLSSSGWSSNAQTVSVTGISATETAQVIQPIPAIASQAAYMEAGVYASGQAANSLTFTCKTAPTSNLTVYVLIQNLS